MPAAGEALVRRGPDTPFSVLGEAFIDAAAARPEELRCHRLTFAGRPVHLEIVGGALENDVLPAFEHLVDTVLPDTGAQAVFRLREGEVGELAELETSAEFAWMTSGPGWRVSLSQDGRYLCEERAGRVLWLDRATGDLHGLYQRGDRRPLSDRARPFTRMMSQICAAFGVLDIHAGLVGRQGRGVLLVGGSGRGKTTTTIDCLAGGLEFLSDDTCALGGSSEQGFSGYSLYCSAQMAPAKVSRWPALAQDWLMPGPCDPKAILLPFRPWRHAMARRTEIVAVVVPAVTDGRSRLRPASPQEVLKAVIHDSVETRRFGLGADGFRRLTALTAKAPCHRLELNIDPAQVAEDVARIIGNPHQ